MSRSLGLIFLDSEIVNIVIDNRETMNARGAPMHQIKIKVRLMPLGSSLSTIWKIFSACAGPDFCVPAAQNIPVRFGCFGMNGV